MRKKAKKQETVTNEPHFCGDCGHGKWYYTAINLTLTDKTPICCKCKFHKYAKIRSTPACANWIAKKKGELTITT